MSGIVWAIIITITILILVLIFLRLLDKIIDLSNNNTRLKIKIEKLEYDLYIAHMFNQQQLLSSAKENDYVEPVLDNTTKHLIALATNPGANYNEACNAALQACKRLSKK